MWRRTGVADAPNCTGERLLAQDGSKLVEFDQEMAHFAEKREKHLRDLPNQKGSMRERTGKSGWKETREQHSMW